MSIDESLDIGLDTRSPVDETYRLPFKFTGTINRVTYNIKPEQVSAQDRTTRDEMLAAARDVPAR
jgi:arylsulfatase